MLENKQKLAKLFKNGRSQAVRLPKQFRFEGTEVRIRRSGQKVILEPIVSTREAADWHQVRKLAREMGMSEADFTAMAARVLNEPD
jgi:antitoxin VapB